MKAINVEVNRSTDKDENIKTGLIHQGTMITSNQPPLNVGSDNEGWTRVVRKKASKQP